MEAAFDRVVTDGLVKTFGPTRALAGVSVTLDSAKVTVIEGPNGSGKSTLLSILAQQARPTRGHVKYGDLDGAKNRAALRSHIGILAHTSMLYPSLTGRENLSFFADLHRIGRAAERIETLAERFEIGRFFDRPTRTYSRGQLQRVALARAVLHRPKLLLLDEPSTGLDTNAVERLVSAIEAERDAGTILVLVTHDPDLASRLADVRIRLHRGKQAKVAR